jgi:uncharacterized protein YbbC (DUF1343 family)
MNKIYTLTIALMLLTSLVFAKRGVEKIKVGAEKTNLYLPKLANKKVAMVVNPTSLVNNMHLVDYLIQQKVKITTIFGPEHGFRGTADAGEKIKNDIDPTTNIPVVSLYGNHKKPTKGDLANVDIVVFDIQDVGVRFYTYISTLQYVMEACAENKKPLIVLDRPNPNGHYVDGPVLENKYKSFVGMQNIPIVHGMTIGEYAKMLNGEGLLTKKVKAALTVIPCDFYAHYNTYSLKIPPSPNLRSDASILLYPSLCLFEGTDVSVGRGTDHPFEVFGHPDYKPFFNFSFTPKPSIGSKDPLFNGKACYGENLAESPNDLKSSLNNRINISYLMMAYSASIDKTKFFNTFFEKLAGNATLRKQIMDGVSEEVIRKSWMPGLVKFNKTRKKYLLYPDFE